MIGKEYTDTVLKFLEHLAITNDMDPSFVKADKVSIFVSGASCILIKFDNNLFYFRGSS